MSPWEEEKEHFFPPVSLTFDFFSFILMVIVCAFSNLFLSFFCQSLIVISMDFSRLRLSFLFCFPLISMVFEWHLIRHWWWQHTDDNDDRNVVYRWLTFISSFQAKTRARSDGNFCIYTCFDHGRYYLWNLCFHFCLCFATEIFTVSINRFSRQAFHWIYFSRKLHGRTSRTSRDMGSMIGAIEDGDSVKSADLVIESRERTIENSATALDSTNRDKKAYLKSLEQSLRTGQRINNGDDDDDIDDSHSTPSKFIRHFLNKHIRRTRRNSLETTELWRKVSSSGHVPLIAIFPHIH